MTLDQELTCVEIVELITDYLEERLSVEETERFELHLVFCDGCQNYLEQIRETIAATGRLRTEGMPADLQERLFEAFRAWSGA